MSMLWHDVPWYYPRTWSFPNSPGVGVDEGKGSALSTNQNFTRKKSNPVVPNEPITTRLIIIQEMSKLLNRKQAQVITSSVNQSRKLRTIADYSTHLNIDIHSNISIR